jgi:curved DNA-binding protein CbpA
LRPLSAQSFYELLEVSPDASSEEISRAYQIARATYEPTSLATYSIFTEEESHEILRRVEEAWEVLGDERRRVDYDRRLVHEGRAEEDAGEAASTRGREAPEPGSPARARTETRDIDRELEETLAPADGVYDGEVLRRIRVSRGVEIEEIAEVTKISPVYLRLIEQNRFHDLPAAVYLRGFLRQYAHCLRLDPARVTESYMERFAAPARGEP